MLVLVPFLVSLGLAELALRFYLDSHTFYDVEMARYANELKRRSDNPLIGHEHRPDRSLHVMNVDVVINSDGFRDDEYSLERTGSRRIIFLGDSLTFGWGVEKEQSFEHLLERMLDEKTPTEIINFGAGNYNTTQEVSLFKEKGLAYQPDEVVLFYFINDAEPVPEKSSYAWLAHSRLVTFFWSRVLELTAQRSEAGGFREYYANLYRDDRPGWKQTREALLQLAALCRDNGIGLKVVMLPELHNLADYTFSGQHDLLGRFLSQSGIDYLDLAPMFSGQKRPESLWVARDDAHPNAIAHRLIAEYSLPFISGDAKR